MEKYKVIKGSVRTESGEVKKGGIVSLRGSDAEALLDIGWIVEYEEMPEGNPDMGWTRDELNDYAEKAGIDNPESLPRKQAVLDAIEEVKQQ